MKRRRHLIITALGILLLLIEACGIFHRHIESVIDIELECDTSVVHWGDTVSIQYRIVNKTDATIEVSDTPGVSLDLDEISVWEIRNAERPKSELIRFPRLRPSYYSVNKIVDTSYYLSIEPKKAITGIKTFSFHCRYSDTKTIELDTWMIDISTTQCDTGDYILNGKFESISTGRAQGHQAAIGWAWTKKPLKFTVLARRKKLREYVNPYFEEIEKYRTGKKGVIVW